MTTENRLDPSQSERSALRPPRSSRERYRGFVKEYKREKLDSKDDSGYDEQVAADSKEEKPSRSPLEFWGFGRAKRREYLREYLLWLWPHRYSVTALFVLALLAAGLEM